jgi:hypothetical protein
VITEFLAFLVHLVDRMTATALSPEQRQEFIGSVARHLADTMQENRSDAQGAGDYRRAFINRLNERAEDYSEFSFREDEPGFAFRRYLGENVRAVMGERDNKWITDQVMDIEVPEILKPLKKAVRDLLPATPKESEI